MLGVDPRGKHLEVTDEGGEDVLDDDIPDDTVEPAEMACCLPDEDGTECEDLTADECQHEGGTAPGAASCMPDPCATSPEQETRCCLPNEQEAECEDTTPAECNAEHGMDIGQGSCEPNPCTQPAPGVERCCIPENAQGEQDDGNVNEPPECEQLTADHCHEEGGTASGTGSCDPNPCVASPSGAFVAGGASGLF